MADDAAPLSAEDVQKRERLRSVLTSLIGEVHVKLSHLRYTIETLQSLADIKANEAVAKTIVDSKKLIEKYPHNNEALYHEPIFLPTPQTRALDAASLQKLRSFQEAVLFTLWKVTVRLQVVDGFVRATASLPKLVSVATTLKQLKALIASIPDSVAPEVVAAHDTTVRAVRERALSRTTRAPSAPAPALHDRPVSPDHAPESRDRAPTISAADLPALGFASAASSAAASPVVSRSPATPLRPRHGTLSAIVPPTLDSADAQAGGGTDERNVLLVSIDASCTELDRRLDACAAPPAAAAAAVLRTHTMLCSARAVISGHSYPYADLPVKERARFAAAVRDAARVGKIAMLAHLNEFAIHELRAHLRRARERLGAAPTLLAMISFACMLRDVALCVADAEDAGGAGGGDALLGGAEMRRAHDAQRAFHTSMAGRLLESAARLNREVADDALMKSELAHFAELEAAVIDANAREQVLELVIRTLKAKTRALTREQYAGDGGAARSSGADEDEDVDINVLELELLELTVQLDARAAALTGGGAAANNDGDEVVDAHSAATKLCSELVQALCAQGAHYIPEMARHLRTPAARDDVARFVNATLFPDVLVSRVDLVLLRALGAAVQREAADAGRCDAVLPLDGSSFARSLLLRYGRRRALRSFAAHVLRDVLVELCRDPPLDADAELTSTPSAKLPSDSIARLQKYCGDIFERLGRLVAQTPVGVRWLARELLSAMQQHYAQDCGRAAAGEAAVSRFVFGTLLGQAVLYPDLYSVFRMDEMPQTRHNLTLLSRALIAVGCGVAPSGALAPLAAFVTQARPALARYVAALADVGDLASHLDYPQRPPLSDAGATLVRAPLCHVLRPTELLKWSCLLDSTRTRMLAPSPSAATDALVARTLRAIDMMSASDKRAPVPAEAPIDDTPAALAESVPPTSNIASIERMLATFADQIRDTSPLVTLGDVKKTYGSLAQFVEQVLAPRNSVAASQLATALRSCALKDETLLHRLDAAYRMRQLGRRQFFVDKCELTQALREHRMEVTALAAEKYSYVQFVQQLSTEWTGDLDVSVGHAAPGERASMASGGALDYFDTETLFAYENSIGFGPTMTASVNDVVSVLVRAHQLAQSVQSRFRQAYASNAAPPAAVIEFIYIVDAAAETCLALQQRAIQQTFPTPQELYRLVNGLRELDVVTSDIEATATMGRVLSNRRLRKRIDDAAAMLATNNAIVRTMFQFRGFGPACPALQLLGEAESVAEWNFVFPEQFVVDFRAFVDGVCTATSERLSRPEEEVLAHIVDTVRTDAVNLYRFVDFMRAFGPLRLCMQNLRSIVSQRWFCGFLTEREAELLLYNQPPGTFLVRLASIGSQAVFSLAHLTVSGGAIVHIDVVPESRGAQFVTVSPDGTRTGPFESLPKLVDAFVAYTAGQALQNSLTDEPWFHGDLSSGEAADMLAQCPMKTYLIRFSGNSNGSYAMSWLADVNSVSHVRFNKQLAGYVVENHTKVFPSIDKLIEHYKDMLRQPLENSQAKMMGLMRTILTQHQQQQEQQQQQQQQESTSPPQASSPQAIVRRPSLQPPARMARTSSAVQVSPVAAAAAAGQAAQSKPIAVPGAAVAQPAAPGAAPLSPFVSRTARLPMRSPGGNPPLLRAMSTSEYDDRSAGAAAMGGGGEQRMSIRPNARALPQPQALPQSSRNAVGATGAPQFGSADANFAQSAQSTDVRAIRNLSGSPMHRNIGESDSQRPLSLDELTSSAPLSSSHSSSSPPRSPPRSPQTSPRARAATTVATPSVVAGRQLSQSAVLSGSPLIANRPMPSVPSGSPNMSGGPNSANNSAVFMRRSRGPAVAPQRAANLARPLAIPNSGGGGGGSPNRATMRPGGGENYAAVPVQPNTSYQQMPPVSLGDYASVSAAQPPVFYTTLPNAGDAPSVSPSAHPAGLLEEVPDLRTPQSTSEAVQRTLKAAQVAVSSASTAGITLPVSVRRLAVVVSGMLKPAQAAIGALQTVQSVIEPIKAFRDSSGKTLMNPTMMEQLFAPLPALASMYSVFIGELQKAIAACGERRVLQIGTALCIVVAQAEHLRMVIDFLPWATQVIGASMRESGMVREALASFKATCNGRSWCELLGAALRPVFLLAPSVYAVLRHTTRSHPDASLLCAVLPLMCAMSGAAERAWRISDNHARMVQLMLLVRGVDAFGPLLTGTRVLLHDIEMAGRFADPNDKKMKKPRDVRLLVFSDAILWCKVEAGSTVAAGRIMAPQVVVRSLPVEGDAKYMLEVVDQETQLSVRLLAPSAGARGELQALITMVRNAHMKERLIMNGGGGGGGGGGMPIAVGGGGMM